MRFVDKGFAMPYNCRPMDYHKQLKVYQERRERIRRQYKDGVSAERIAQMWKISRQRVYQILGMK